MVTLGEAWKVIATAEQRAAEIKQPMNIAVVIHPTCLVTLQSRLLVFIQWAIQDLTFRRGARSITGVASAAFDFTREVSQRSRTLEIQSEPVSSPGGR